MKQSTLCYLIREVQEERELLLAMKKKGFGKGKWNGIGGIQKKEKGDKTIVDTVLRETKEEIGVELKETEKVAILTFYYPYSKEWNQDTHVFIAKKWQGQLKESEEVRPKWFSINKIPFDRMWDDDRSWLPLILEGKKLKAEFIFKEGGIVKFKDIRVIDKLA